MAITERSGVLEPDIVPPCQRHKGAVLPVGVFPLRAEEWCRSCGA